MLETSCNVCLWLFAYCVRFRVFTGQLSNSNRKSMGNLTSDEKNDCVGFYYITMSLLIFERNENYCGRPLDLFDGGIRFRRVLTVESFSGEFEGHSGLRVDARFKISKVPFKTPKLWGNKSSSIEFNS